MIKNGYLIFAILQILVTIVIIYGIYTHVSSLLTENMDPLDKFILYTSAVSLPPLLITSITSLIKWILLNWYTNNYSLEAVMKCC